MCNSITANQCRNERSVQSRQQLRWHQEWRARTDDGGLGTCSEGYNPRHQGCGDLRISRTTEPRGFPSSADAIRPAIASEARRRGSLSKCAYLAVVEAWA